MIEVRKSHRRNGRFESKAEVEPPPPLVRSNLSSGHNGPGLQRPESASRLLSIPDASPHSAAGLIFCNLSLAASRRNISLRFLTIAVAAPAQHHCCQFFIAARL